MRWLPLILSAAVAVGVCVYAEIRFADHDRRITRNEEGREALEELVPLVRRVESSIHTHLKDWQARLVKMERILIRDPVGGPK